MVNFERDLKRRRHESTSDLSDAHEERKKLKLEVKLLPPCPPLSSSKYSPPLLILPREIRDLIYRRVFSLVFPTEGCEGSAAVVVQPQLSIGRKSSHPTAFGLLSVNSQVHVEASEIFYRHSIFRFQYSWSALTFFRAIGPKKSSMIYHLQLKVGPHDWPEAGHQLQWAGVLGSTALNAVRTLQLYNLHFHQYSLDTIFIHSSILECLVDVVLGLFKQRHDQKIIPSLTLVGFKEGEESKFPSSWNIVVKHSVPRASESKITPPLTQDLYRRLTRVLIIA